MFFFQDFAPLEILKRDLVNDSVELFTRMKRLQSAKGGLKIFCNPDH